MKSNTILGATLIVLVITLATKLLGYAEKMVIAYFWGTGYEADTYSAVFAILMAVSIFFREAFEPGFLNTAIKQRKSEGRIGSWHVFTAMFYFMIAVSLLLAVSMFMYPEKVTDIFLSGFTGARHAMATDFFRISSVGLFFLLISTVTNTALLANKSFGGIAFSDFVFKAAIVLSIFLFYKAYGAYSLAIGFAIAAVVKFAMHILYMRPLLCLNDLRPRKGYLEVVLMLSWPLIVGNVFAQVSAIADNTFASYLPEGAIASLSYAKKIIDLPVVLLPYTLSVVIFPFFSEMSIEKNNAKLNLMLRNALKYILLLFLPVMIVVGMFSDEIVKIIFERGAFDAQSTMRTSLALSAYNAGIVAFALETVMVVYFFSMNRIKLPVAIGIVCVIIDILLIALLIDRLGYLSIAYALVISKWIKFALLFYFLPAGLTRGLTLDVIVKIFLALAIFTLVMSVYDRYILDGMESLISLMLSLAVFCVAAFALYVFVLHAFKIIAYKDELR